MGGGTWEATDWTRYAASAVSGKKAEEIFTSRTMKPEYDPAKIEVRESRDSEDNPRSTPIIIGSDVTGSMGVIADKMMRDGLNTLATEILARKPVTNPHLMMAAIGDTEYDRAPLQVTQFEADIRVAQQAAELWIERGGGPNGGESYLIAPLFAATKVSADAIEKRGRKGYVFTIGDEPPLMNLTRDHAKRFLGLDLQADLSAADIVRMTERNWEYFHVILAGEGACRGGRFPSVEKSWRSVLPQRTIILEDINALAETVVSLIQVTEGANAEEVSASWSGSTAVAVAGAIHGQLPGRPGGTGLVRL